MDRRVGLGWIEGGGRRGVRTQACVGRKEGCHTGVCLRGKERKKGALAHSSVYACIHRKEFRTALSSRLENAKLSPAASSCVVESIWWVDGQQVLRSGASITCVSFHSAIHPPTLHTKKPSTRLVVRSRHRRRRGQGLRHRRCAALGQHVQHGLDLHARVGEGRHLRLLRRGRRVAAGRLWWGLVV